MGVKKLWSVLEPAGLPVKLTDLRGFCVAIDLSYWMVEMSQINKIQGIKMPWLKLHIRNLFWRCYHLLRNQVRPVFVIDGVSPDVKRKTIEMRKTAMGLCSESPNKKNKNDHGPISECKELLECLGVPYLVSAGEAEALCAKLDQDGLVDGCITDDSDAFLYGANTVFKNFSLTKQKVGDMKAFHSEAIKEKLGLNREKLVAMALLLGSDYTDGAKNIGPDATMKLLGKHGTLSNTDVLETMKSWRGDPQGKFSAFEEFKMLPKPAHCSKCKHQGSLLVHKAKGCPKCLTKKTCIENQANCDCEYHKKMQEISDHAIEIRVRRWAIEDPNFPNEEVIKEYLQPKCDPVSVLNKVEWNRPDFDKLQKYLTNVLKFPILEAHQKINELLVSWELTHSKGIQQTNPLKCVKIMKSRIQNSIPVLEVLWGDQGLRGQNIVTIEDRKTMTKHFPRAVKTFDEQTSIQGQPCKKLNKLKKHQRSIANFFQSKKKVPSNGHERATFNLVTDCFPCSLEDFVQLSCAKAPNSTPKQNSEQQSAECDKVSFLNGKAKKRKSYHLDEARNAKKPKQ